MTAIPMAALELRLHQIRQRVVNSLPGLRSVLPDGSAVALSRRVKTVDIVQHGSIPPHLRGIIRVRSEASWLRSERELYEHARDDLGLLIDAYDRLRVAAQNVLDAHKSGSDDPSHEGYAMMALEKALEVEP